MQHKEIGLILKKLGQSSAMFSLLTQNQGKITLIVLDSKKSLLLHPGCLIEFYPEAKKDAAYTTKSATIIDSLSVHDTSDLYWLHHLLELNYYFIQPSQPEDDALALTYACSKLVDHKTALVNEWDVLQKSCVAIFLLLMGFYPPEAITKHLIFIKNMLLLNIDFAKNQQVDLLKGHLQALLKLKGIDLEDWIIKCIHSHPQVGLFKTLDCMYTKSF
jgi:hypothetical protein